MTRYSIDVDIHKKSPQLHQPLKFTLRIESEREITDAELDETLRYAADATETDYSNSTLGFLYAIAGMHPGWRATIVQPRRNVDIRVNDSGDQQNAIKVQI